MSFLSVLSRKPNSDELPLLALRELVLFPHTMVPVFISQKHAVAAIDEALKRDRRVFAACRKPLSKDDETYQVGSVARIVQQLKLPDGTVRVLLEGEYRARSQDILEKYGVTMVRVSPLEGGGKTESAELEAMARSVQKAFTQYAELSKKVNAEVPAAVDRADNPERLANLVSNALAVKIEKKIELLSIEGDAARLAFVLDLLDSENEIISIQRKISGKVKSRMDKTQREYILNEQLKEINKELGKEGEIDEFREIEKAIEDRKPPEEVLAKARKELARLRKLQSLSPEAGVLRGYLEWISDLPWSDRSEDSRSLEEAELILDQDHYDMRKAKERIVEFIAVRRLTETIKGPILCFVGPPGTGKTSLGRSVARALGRNFVRISLGGVRDEAEIRGHRKTYVGALPGKILQSMRKAATTNPVFLLDEIDKLSGDFRGDPASALLEVLDPEQNSTFTDHYLEVPYDLSKVLFIATANSLHTIPYPLLDRMEIIEIPGYGEREKLEIARKFLIPKQLEENGLGSSQATFKDQAILDLIRYYTMESGVRSLEREIARCVRRLARDAVSKGFVKSAASITTESTEQTEIAEPAAESGSNEDGQPMKPISAYKRNVAGKDLEKLLGRRKHKHDVVLKESGKGVCYGLAWTETGGTLLPVETVRFDGSGELILTGNLGDVMKESARTALSYLRSVSHLYAFKMADIGKVDFHIHVPEGAIPKDGPSAGITLASALLSTLCELPPRPRVAMTGELTLTGRVLPIGGLKEKLLAAIRNHMELVIIPKGNEDEFRELDGEVKNAIQVELVEDAAQAFALLFGSAARSPATQEATTGGNPAS